MNRKQLLIIARVVVLGLLAAFPLTWLLPPTGSSSGSRGDKPAIHQTDANGILSEEQCLTARLREETPVSGKTQQLGPISLVSSQDNSRTAHSM